ncbi:MAG: hypothetical protein IPN95_15770 [Bacteroidetes bacterium]|nr:hypothetical protein [Bacteroidota bacterium]
MEAQMGAPGDSAFGPVTGSEFTKFRVTSLHEGVLNGNSRSDPRAFAVCNGRVRVQQDGSNPDLLTIILAPDVELIPGIPIKYFVYRGIKKDSLLSNPTILVPAAPLNDQIFTDNYILNNHPDTLGLAFRSSTNSPPSTLFEREDNDTIDSIFFESTTLRALHVMAGKELGLFDGNSFGFEILLGSVWAEHTLDIIRNVSLTNGGNFVEVLNSFSGAEIRAVREKVYTYLDPAAFFGMCTSKGLTIRYLSTVSGSPTAIRTPQQLFDELLTLFLNRSKSYIDIRNENGLSYNFYLTYNPGIINVGLDSFELHDIEKDNVPMSSANSRSYETSGWPILILDYGSQSPFAIPSGSEKAGIRIQLAWGVSNPGDRRTMYLANGHYYYDQTGKKKRGRLFSVNNANSYLVLKNQSGWCNEIVLGIHSVDEGQTTVPVSCYFRGQYSREYSNQPASLSQLTTACHWDNVFSIGTTGPRWKNSNLSNWQLTGHIREVNTGNLNNQAFDGIVESGIAVDRDPISFAEERVTLYYVPIAIRRNPDFYFINSNAKAVGTGGEPSSPRSFFQLKEGNDIASGTKDLFLQKVSEYRGAAAPPNPGQYLSFLTYTTNPRGEDPTQPSGLQVQVRNNPESLYAISMSRSEYQLILDAISANQLVPDLHPIFLKRDLEQVPRETEDQNLRAYIGMTLKVVGALADGTIVEVPINGISLFSLFGDGRIFCTNSAAQFESIPTTWSYTSLFVPYNPPTSGISANVYADFVRGLGQIATTFRRYSPMGYAILEQVRTVGAKIILHSNPGEGNQQRVPYQVRIQLDPLLYYNPNGVFTGGRTDSPTYYSGILPGGSSPSSSSLGFRFTNLSTLPAFVYTLPYSLFIRIGGELNLTRYADLNKDRNLKSSEVFEYWVQDYSEDDISQGLFSLSKLYLERTDTPLSNNPGYTRTTLARLRSLGSGTLDWNIPIDIRINHDAFVAKSTTYSFTPQGASSSVQVADINPKQDWLFLTVLHELGHAIFKLRDPLMSLIWDMLEGYFPGLVRMDSGITTRPPSFDANSTRLLEKSRLILLPTSNIPYPQFPDTVSAMGPLVDAYLEADGFLPQTGAGHLRGDPNAQFAAVLGAEAMKGVLDLPLKLLRVTSQHQIQAPYNEATQWFDQEYIFLNLDDSKLQ